LSAVHEARRRKKCARIQLAVMEMWKPFRNATTRHAPQANNLFDKFHIMRHLGDALDTVRKRASARLSGKDRRFSKGQKYPLLSHRENLPLDGRPALKRLLAANIRLNTASLLKESFGQLGDSRREGWAARRFFENWKKALKWRRLEPYEKFAEWIERHWDGIAASCRPENKVSLGFVEGLNNKIRVIQRRAYGLRDEEYLRLKSCPACCPSSEPRRTRRQGRCSPTPRPTASPGSLPARAAPAPSATRGIVKSHPGINNRSRTRSLGWGARPLTTHSSPRRRCLLVARNAS
jgi:transposase